jgi:hypothetical protein
MFDRQRDPTIHPEEGPGLAAARAVAARLRAEGPDPACLPTNAGAMLVLDRSARRVRERLP